jgi:DNA-binding IclR family transcriptional regulator
MTALRDKTRETTQLGVLSGLEGIIIDQVEGLEPLRIVVVLGLRFALHNNAPGKLLLAYLPPEQQKAVLSQIKLTSTTPRTITKKTGLRQECERIVANGYSTDYAEADEGIHCVAAPIFEVNGSAVGAIWVSGPAKRMPKSRFSELGQEVREAGQSITRLIGELA